MDYLDALRSMHAILEPRTYCEIGCRFGSSLALASCPTVGIDPEFEIAVELRAPTRLYRRTSDEFFASEDLRALLGGPLDLGFVDGMHLVEFALRDFTNLERASHSAAAIAIDDVLPQEIAHASRERTTGIWNGDVYRLLAILREYRPDLAVSVYETTVHRSTTIKGLAVVTNLDPSSTVLRDAYSDIGAQLSRGRWTASTIAAIAEGVAPRPAARLEADLRDFLKRHD